MFAASKAVARRVHDVRFASRYLMGNGIDISGGNDPVSQFREVFPGMREVHVWDPQVDGDAQFLANVPDASLDFVHSTHRLEHMHDPYEALRNWFRVLRPEGHLVCMVPDEDLYEQGRFPSTFNADHKWTFTMWKQRSWSPKSINVFDLIGTLGEAAQPMKVEMLDATFRYQLLRCDQTETPIAEAGIEFVIRKRPVHEIAARGRLPQNA
jgi:SAM-dependent methyltransferase